MGYPCTNQLNCPGIMEDRGNSFYCYRCGQMAFKLPEQDVPWEPLPRQKDFLYNQRKYSLYVGGVGSGKTMAGAYKSIMKTQQHPGGQGLVGAQTFPQLRDATMKTFFEICPDVLLYKGDKNKAFNKTDGILTFANEFQVLFRPLYDPDVLKSLNLVFFWIDEASNVKDENFYQLQARLRSRYGWLDGVPAHEGFVTSNPNGRDWLYKVFVEQEDPLYFWINAPTRENKFLPPDYESNLRKRWSDAWVKRYLDGSFDAFEGQIYPDLDQNLHSWMPLPDFEGFIHRVPEGWRVVVGLDHGFTNPTAIGFFAISPDNNLIILFDEIYETGQIVSYFAAKIKEKLASWGRSVRSVNDWLIDPSTKGQLAKMTGRAVLSEYHDQGLHFRQANNQVQAGILQVMEYMMVDQMIGRPRFVMHRRCANAWREMGGYRWKPLSQMATSGNVPEEPIKDKDHMPDMIRYVLMSLPNVRDLKPTSLLYHMNKKNGLYELDPKNLPWIFRGEKSGVSLAGPRWPNF